MKKDFHRTLVMMTACIWLSACAAQKTPDSVYQNTTDDCVSNVIPQQFLVTFENGSHQVIHAASKDEFINGYLTENLANVRLAEPDYRVQAALPSGEGTSGIAYVNHADNWGPARIDAQSLWQQNVRGSGIVVAVVDSGMDIHHPQLANRLFANPGEIGTDSTGKDKATNGIDDDGNGFIDDAYGYDFVNNGPLTGDHTYHGTHVSGIIAAEHNDTTTDPNGASYVEGVAPQAELLPLAFLDENGSGSMSDGVRAIAYAVARGARVINASWGGSQCSATLRDEIASLQPLDVVFVAAAGNESSDDDTTKTYPASLNLAPEFTVGATGIYDYMANYSNYGVQSVHIFAPGTDIISTVPVVNGGTGMAKLSGTSMATPFVSGAIALLMSAEPKATASQIRQALYTSAAKRPDYVNASQGRLDLSDTLSELRHIMGK